MNRVLDVGYTLNLSGKEFIIKYIVGKGASSVTYLAEHGKTEHILKECNPLGISMHRNEIGELVADSDLSRQKFEECLERFKAGADKQLSFRLTEDLKNPTSNIQDIYHANGTAYIDMTYFGGKTYDKLDNETLYDLFRRMKALAQIVGHYHKLGYLHLDIKPQNIYTIPETPEMVMMFDFDSVTPMNDVNAIVSSSYTDVWAAPEQKMPKYRNQICETTDLFAIGEIIFFRIFGKHSEESDRYSFSQYEYLPENKWFENVNPRVLPMITELLHKTLSCSTKKRYQKAEELVEQLDKIIEFSNPKEPFLKSSLPNVSGFFTGRDTEIEEIHKRLQENNVLFLSGIGGIGKSELAKHYAEAYKDSYDVIVFAPFLHDIQTMMTNDSYVQIHNFFQYPEEKPNEYFERKMRELAKLCDERILIIVDNFDTTEDENLSRLLKLNCKMLITTRRDFTEPYPDFQLDLGTLTNPVEVFNEHYKKLLSDDERKCVDEIIEIVDGHTMTVELLAKQMMAGRVKPEKMLEKLKSGGISESGKEKVSHANEKGDISRENTYDHIQALFDLSDLAEDEKYILANLSLIPHTGIPAELFKEWCEIEDFNTINNLAIEGWIRWDKEKDYISLHPVVCEIILPTLRKNVGMTDPLFKSMYSLLVDSSNKLISIPQRDILLHISERVLQQRTESLYIAKCLSVDYWVENVCGSIKNDFEILNAFYAFSINILEQRFSQLTSELVEAYGNWATLLYYKNAMPLAKKYVLKAIKLAETELHINRNVIAKLYTTLGCIHHEQSLFEDAERAHKYALECTEYNFSPVIYNNLAMVYRDCDRFDEAEKCYFEALELQKGSKEEAQKDESLIYDNLGGMYEEIGDYEKAVLFHKKAIDIRIELLGEKNVDTARSYSGIGLVYIRMKRYDLAERYLTKALEIEIDLRGENSEIVAHTYNNLAGMYDDSGDAVKAEQHYKKAIELFQKHFGENNSYVALVSNNLGAFFLENGRLDEAFDMITYALQVRISVFGNVHSETAGSLYWLGLVYEKKGDYIKARDYLSKAYGIYSEKFHPDNVRVQRAKAALTRVSV